MDIERLVRVNESSGNLCWIFFWLLTRTFSDPEINEEYDTDDDLELEVTRKSLQKGQRKFEKNIFAEAETLLQHDLDHKTGFSQRTETFLSVKKAEKGAKLETHSGLGRTPLIQAASEGHKEIVRLLIDRGANIGRRSNKESTALIVAALKG